ncbi:integrase core domain-containing protein, partial [Kluyvera sichuanensis]
GNIFRTLEEQQAWFSHYREEFNQERPHEALGGTTPGEVWRPSSRSWDGKVPEYEWPEGARLYRVMSKGVIHIGKEVFLSEALLGEYIMLEEKDDGVEAIIFNGITLAYYDRKSRSIIRID